MNDEQKREALELWRKAPYLTYYEAMSLLTGRLPESKVVFSENENDSKRYELIERILEHDIQQFELKMYFDATYGYDGATQISPPQYATSENLQHFISHPNIYYGCWWIEGKLSAQELKEWLQKNGITSSFFGTAAGHIPDSLNDILPEPPSKPAPVVKEPPQPEITQEIAAVLAGVGERTIRNWEKGEGTPYGYPGRQSRAAFIEFVATLESNRRLRDRTRAASRARPGGDMNNFSEEEDL